MKLLFAGINGFPFHINSHFVTGCGKINISIFISLHPWDGIHIMTMCQNMINTDRSHTKVKCGVGTICGLKCDLCYYLQVPCCMQYCVVIACALIRHDSAAGFPPESTSYLSSFELCLSSMYNFNWLWLQHWNLIILSTVDKWQWKLMSSNFSGCDDTLLR